MARNVIGIRLNADVRQFNKGMQSAIRSFTGLEYIAERAAKNIGKSKEEILKLPKDQQEAALAAMERLNKRMRAIGLAGGGMLMAGMSAAITSATMWNSIFKPALEKASDFQREMARLGALTGIAYGDGMFKQFEDIAFDVGLATSFSGDQVARAITNLITAGLDKHTAKAVVPHLVNMVEGSFGELDLAKGAKILAIGLKKFQLGKEFQDPAEQARYMSDALLQLKQSSRIEFHEVLGLLDSLQAGPGLLGMSAKETFALSTALMRLGTGSRRAGMQINAMSGALFKVIGALDEDVKTGRIGKLIVAANELGFGLEAKQFYNKAGELRSGLEILTTIIKSAENVEKKLGKGKAKIALARLFSGKTGVTLSEAVKQLKIEVKDANGAIKESIQGIDALKFLIDSFSDEAVKGKAQKAAEAYRKTWEGTSKIIEGIGETLGIVLADPIFKAAGDALLSIAETFSAVAKILRKDKDLANLVTTLTVLAFAFTTISAVVLTLFGGLLLLMGLLGGPLITVLGAIAGALGLSGLIPAAGVLLAILLGIGGALAWIAGVVGGVIYGFSQMKEIDGVVLSFENLKKALDALVDFWDDFQAPEDKFKALDDTGLTPFVRVLLLAKHAFNSFMEGFKGAEVFTPIIQAVEFLAGAFIELFFALGLITEISGDTWKDLGAIAGFTLRLIFAGMMLIVYAIAIAIYAVAKLVTWLNELGLLEPILWGIAAVLAVIGIAFAFILGIVTLLFVALFGSLFLFALGIGLIAAAILAVIAFFLWLGYKIAEFVHKYGKLLMVSLQVPFILAKEQVYSLIDAIGELFTHLGKLASSGWSILFSSILGSDTSGQGGIEDEDYAAMRNRLGTTQLPEVTEGVGLTRNGAGGTPAPTDGNKQGTTRNYNISFGDVSVNNADNPNMTSEDAARDLVNKMGEYMAEENNASYK